MSTDRRPDCRYCERYGRPCGRDHTVSVADWSRTWNGNPPVTGRHRVPEERFLVTGTYPGQLPWPTSILNLPPFAVADPAVLPDAVTAAGPGHFRAIATHDILPTALAVARAYSRAGLADVRVYRYLTTESEITPTHHLPPGAVLVATPGGNAS